MTDTLSASIVVYDTDPGLLNKTIDAFHTAVENTIKAGKIKSARLTLISNADKPLAHDQSGSSIELIQSQSNIGYGRGHNVAMLASSADIHLILNPDVILAPDSLTQAIQMMADEPDIVAVGPRGYSPEGQDLYLCKRYPTLTTLFMRGLLPRTHQQPQKHLVTYEYRDKPATARYDVEMLSGCAILARTSSLQTLDGFDPGYFLYFEDFDLSMRLGKLGPLVYCPQMELTHYGGHASRKGLQHIGYFIRSGVRFFNKWGWRV